MGTVTTTIERLHLSYQGIANTLDMLHTVYDTRYNAVAFDTVIDALRGLEKDILQSIPESEQDKALLAKYWGGSDYCRDSFQMGYDVGMDQGKAELRTNRPTYTGVSVVR